MTESIEHYKPIAEKSYNQSGSLYSSSVSGGIFYVGDDEYIVDIKEGEPVIYDYETKKRVNNREVIASIKAQIEQDREVVHARNKVAEILSDKGPVLAEILRWHIEYKGGKVSKPVKKEGIDFYSVGHNASHSFYAGVKDGKAYKMSVCYDYDHETGKDLSEEHICEVTGDWGYMGHY
jgi:hypothetical protein